jgi:hypothetical protein
MNALVFRGLKDSTKFSKIAVSSGSPWQEWLVMQRTEVALDVIGFLHFRLDLGREHGIERSGNDSRGRQRDQL